MKERKAEPSNEARTRAHHKSKENTDINPQEQEKIRTNPFKSTKRINHQSSSTADPAMDPDGDYESRHSIRSTASDDVTSPSKIFAPGGDSAKLPGKSPKGGDAYKGPTAPPMEEDSSLATAPTATDAAASSMDPRGNAYADMMRETKMMGLEPPVSNSVAIPIGFDSDVMALPEATALPIVSSTANEGTKMPPASLEEVNVEDTEAQVDEEQPTPVPVPSPRKDEDENNRTSAHSDSATPKNSAEQKILAKSANMLKPKHCVMFFVVVLGTILIVLFGTRKGQLLMAECGWDGGDCLVEGVSDCHVDRPRLIGNGWCNGGDYNTAECGWDGGDCVVDGYPDCHVLNPEWIGNGRCNAYLNTVECGWDGGDCR